MGEFNPKYLRPVAVALIFGALAFSNQVSASSKGAGRSPASTQPKASAKTTTQNVDRALDVKGQSRAWNRLSGVHRDREAIDFVQTRTDYRTEIENTRF